MTKIVARQSNSANSGPRPRLGRQALLANVTLLGLVLGLAAPAPAGSVLTAWLAVCLGAQIVYFGLGMAMSRLSARSLLSLAYAPLFLLWKLGVDLVAVFTMGRRPWTRTSRAQGPSSRT